ncbi:MAG: hypothetical protein WC203_03245 [Candidatus Bathyarchaeia archaeon]|jgi:predicted  nucleic acid-binding Zn-ribbon protein|nr:hypothetical protein [Candidatus Bathyarchaeota archaeon]MDI9578016.1 hypothetical protein [Thermoproteota archaeon]MDT8782327.1 hypothetical protein [Candidatus Bathyarchaeota archaeon]NLD65054.1 hypothetical protein [Thermoproteota archaeon]
MSLSVDIKKDHKCYVCGRTEKEFFSHLDSKIYDKEIAELKSSIQQLYKELTSDVKSLFEMIKDYDSSKSIKDLIVEREAAAKLLYTYLNESKASCSFEDVELGKIKEAISSSLKELYADKFPNLIKVDKSIHKKEEKLAALTQKKEAIEYLINHPNFKAYETIIKRVGKEGIPIKYRLCPVCSDLSVRYLQSIQSDEDWEWVC